MSEITPLDSASNITVSSTKKRPKSVVWEHFTVSEEDKSKAICTHCPKHNNKFAYNNYGTKNLLTHLNSQHRDKLNGAEKDPKQPRIDFMLKNPSVVFSQEVFEDQLIKWVVLNDHSFNEVETAPFRELLYLFKPNLKIFSADTVKRRILARFEVKKDEMKDSFEKLDR